MINNDRCEVVRCSLYDSSISDPFQNLYLVFYFRPKSNFAMKGLSKNMKIVFKIDKREIAIGRSTIAYSKMKAFKIGFVTSDNT